MEVGARFGRRGIGGKPHGAPRTPRPAEESAAYNELLLVAREKFRGDDAQSRDRPQALAAAEPHTLTDDEAISAYIGPNWRAYRKLWLAMRGAPRLTASPSLSAALFAGMWLVYRKQYVAGAGFITLQALLSVYVAPLTPVAQLLAAAFLGRYGKSMVLMDGVSKLETVRKASLPPGAALKDLSRAGGVNPLAAALALVALVALTASRAASIVEAVQAPAALLGGVLNALP
jgi:hypothetical protein